MLKARRSTKYITLKAPVRPDAMSMEILRREYELGQSLSHPCIVSTLGFEEYSPAGPAILLEYIEGKTLEEYMSGHPTASATDRVLDDIIDGVDYLHHRGVLHNDLKPDNIIVTPGGAARIIDLGLSVSDDSIYKGCLGGSEGFSAPEIMQGRGPSGASSDIYSLGLLMQLLTAGKYRKITAHCCRQDPSERYQNIPALRRALALRRHLPVATAVVVFAIFVLTMVVPQKVEETVAGYAHESLKDRLEKEMSIFFLPVRDSMLVQPDFVSASAIKGGYLLHYIHFRGSLPQEQRLACEEIFAAHTAVLDSILLSLPDAPGNRTK